MNRRFHRSSITRFFRTFILLAILADSGLGLTLLFKPVLGAPGLTLKWVTPNIGAATYVGPLAADLRADIPGLEIVVTGVSQVGAGLTNGTVAALNGNTGAVIWQKSPGSIVDHNPFEIADLNKDGVPEIVLSNQRRTLALFGNNGSTYWLDSNVPSYNVNPVVCDTNADGYYEVFVSSGWGPYEGIDYITALSYDGRILAQNISWHPCWGGMAMADANSDGRFELYQGDRASNYNPSGDPYVNGGWGIRVLDANTLNTIWNDSLISCSSHTPMLADVDKDGVLDVIVGMQNGVDGIAVLKASDGSTVTTGGKNRRGGVNIATHSQPTIADIDNDGNLEFISGQDTNPKIWDLYQWKLDAALPVVCSDPPKVADVNGDGIKDIIAVTGDQVYVYDVFSNGTVVQIDHVSGLNGACDFTLFQDVDNDGLYELVLTSTSGRVYCYDTSTPVSNPKPRSQVSFYSEYRCGVAEYVAPPGPMAPQVSAPSPADNATDVSVTTSTLSFNLTDYQKDPINYTVTTSPNIGSGNGTNVPNGRYQVSVSKLNYSTTYTWNVNTTDGLHANSKIYRFTTGAAPPQQSWWNDNWKYRKRITIDHTKVTSTTTGFAVLIDIVDADVASHAQTDGDDLAFTDYVGQKLNHEIEYFNPSTGHLVAWVNVPTLSSTEDTILFMYYGNSAATNQENPTAVWDSNYILVQHLSETSGTHYDSTSKHNNGTPAGILAQGTAGKIDGCDEFNGGYVELPRVCTSEAQFTFSAWFYARSGSRYFISEWTGNQGAFLQVSGDAEVQFYINGVMVAKPVSLNQWHYAVGTFDGTTARLWLDGGSAVSGGASAPSWPVQDMFLGDRSDHARQFNGFIDEVRVSNIARSSDWINTEYSNQLNPSTFYMLGPEENYAMPAAPTVSDPVPPDGAAEISLNPTLSVNLTDYQGDLMSLICETNTTGSWQNLGTYNNVGNGIHTQATAVFSNYDTKYWWGVRVSDGVYWTNRTYSFTTKSPPPVDWWNASWQYRRTITIDHTKVSSDQTNFPIVVDLTDSSLSGKTQPNGEDFIFLDASNVKLNHEIESYDTSTGHLVSWVNIPFLSSSADTALNLYYGNPTCGDQQNTTAVWDSNYKMVLHLSEGHECRLWGIVSSSLPQTIVLDQLVNLPYSLKNLGGGVQSNLNGWGLAYYNTAEPTVLRGQPPAYTDSNFDLAAQQLAASGAHLAVGHVRNAASGATDIPDPHPFMRYKNGKWWAFGHNGVLDKTILKGLIGSEYLAQNPPTVGSNWDDWRVVDTDLYMLYVLKCIEQDGWNVTRGIADAVAAISRLDSGSMNFFLTDGQTLWGFRRGTNTLYYLYNSSSPSYSVLASQPPDNTQPGWTLLSNYNLIVLTANNPPQLIQDIRTEDPQTQCYDSTVNANNGVLYTPVTQGATGKLAGCYEFNGGYVELPRVCTSEAQFTFSAWFYARSGSRYFISEWTGNQGAFLQVSGDAEVQFYINGVMVAKPVSLNQWHYAVGTFDGTTARLWLDGGSAVSRGASAPSWPVQDMFLGDRSDHARQFNGFIDEVRVSNIARGSDWINTEYSNQLNPSTFYTLGLEISFSGEPVVSNPQPADAATDIKLTTSSLNFTLTDYQHDPINCTVTTNPNIGGFSQNNILNGNYSVPVSDLNYSTAYTWTVSVTDGTYVTTKTYTFTTEATTPPPPANDVVFNSNFDMGNLINVTYKSGAPGYRYYTAAVNYSTASTFTDKHWWFYFSMDNVTGKTVTISIQNGTTADYSTDPVNGNRWPNIEPVYSYDNINWERVPLSGVTFNRTERSFTMNVTVPLGHSKIWLAPLQPYNIGQRDALLAEFASNPYLTVTSLGTTPGGQELKVATITDPAYSNAGKYKSYVTAQQHSGETPGSWNAEGLIRYLLSNDPTAAAIRRSYIFRIVPIVNVDGVYYGRCRYTPLRNGVQYDLNRLWNTNPISNAPFEVSAIFQDIQTFQPNSYNDFHSTINTEQVSPKEALTYTWSTSNTAFTNFMNRIKDGGYPETVRAISSLAGGAFQNVHSRLGVVFAESWENPMAELSSNPGVKLTINDWMSWGAGWAKGNYLYFGDAPATLNVTTTGSGTVSLNDTGPYHYGSIINLTATPAANWTFSQWTGDLTGNQNPAMIVLTGNKTITATFTTGQTGYTLTVNKVGSGNVTKNPDQPIYSAGTLVNLTATPDSGWLFTEWSGDAAGNSSPITITMNSNKNITATFTAINYDDVVFSSSFEMGNLKNVQFQNGNSSGYRFYTGEQNHTIASGMTDKHWWFYFSIDNASGKTITIKLVNNEADDMATRWAEIEPVYSLDNINWQRLVLSNVVVDTVARTFQMTVTLNLTQNKIWLAPLPPYTTGLRDALFAEFASSPYLNVTSLGTTPGGQDLKVATITDKTYNDTGKIKAYVIAMQHSGEVPGGWEADGMIRFLLSNDPTAQAIRRSYIFRIVPITNVDAVYYGISRYTPLRNGTQYDLNRWWSANTADMPFEVAKIYADIQAFQPSSFNDLHSTINTEMGSPKDAVTYTWSTSDATVVAFLNSIRAAGWPDTQRGTSSYACNQVHSRLGVVRSISWENPQDECINWTYAVGSRLTVIDWRNMGKAYAIGVYLNGGDRPNTAPTATNLQLSPAVPRTNDNLTASYTYTDTEGDPENGTEIRWYKNGALQSVLNDSKTVLAILTQKGEVWYFTVKPKDGRTFGNVVQSLSVTILNTPPSIDTYYPPIDPTIMESQSQKFNVTYSDTDGDAVNVQWLRNGALVSTANTYNFTASIGSAGTYNVTVVVSDTQANSTHAWTLVVLAAPNTPPSASNLSISPLSPKATDNLTGNYLYSDADGDPESGSEIEWYNNSQHAPSLDGVLTVPSNLIAKGQTWYFTVRPRDGKAFGALQTSASVIIQNTPPEASSLYITPPSPIKTDALASHYTYFDADGDGEASSQIRWYKNGVVQPGLDDSLSVPSGSATRGETWYFTVKPKDGTDFGALQTSGSVTIQNSPPTIDTHYPTSDPTILEGDTQAFNITYSDPDGETTQAQWYVNDTPVSTTDTYTFASNYASSGTYNITVVVSDGQAQTSYAWSLTVTDVGPVLDMPFDTEASPTPDNSGYGNHGILNGTTWTTAGNGSYYFDGNDSIRIVDSVNLDGDGNWSQLSVEFWFYSSSATQNGKRVIAKRGSTSGTYSYQVGFQTSNGRLYLDVWNPNLYEVEYTTILNTRTWYHIVCTYETGIGSKIYVNGADISAVKVVTSPVGSESGNIAKSRGQPLFISSRYGLQDFFTGLVDNVRIYFKSLPATQAAKHYDESKDVHVNTAPDVTSYLPAIQEPQVNEGETLQFNQTSMDPERDQTTITWLLEGTMESTGQNWTYSPGFADAGIHNVTLVVSDGLLSTTLYWNVTVNNVDRPPIISDYYPYTDPAVPESKGQDFNITCSDPDGDALLIQWYSNDTAAGTANVTSYMFPPSSVGTYNIAVSVSDGLLPPVWQNWTLTVAKGNSPPSMTSVTISPKPAYNDIDLTATPSGWNDPDGDPPGYVYQWQKWNGIGWENITGETSQTLNKANFANGDQVEVLCTPYDGQAYGETRYDSVTIENRAPTINSYTPTLDYPCINTTQQQLFTVTAADSDGDTLSYAWYADGVLNTTTNSYTFDAISGTAGAHNITLVIKDSYGAEARHKWFLTVGANLVMPFDSSDLPVADYAGFDNNGTVTNAIWIPNGKIGGAYNFTGNSYIRIEDASSIGGDGTWKEITIDFWLYVTQNQRGTRIIAKRGSSSGTYGYQIGFQTSTSKPYNTIYFDIWYAAGSSAEIEYQSITANTWNHVVCTFNGTTGGDGLKMYVNGTLRASKAQTGSIYASINQPLYFGSQNTTTGFFTGIVDEVRIYSKALTLQQINQTYYQTKASIISQPLPALSAHNLALVNIILATSPLALCGFAMIGRKKKRALTKLSFPFSPI